MSLHGQTVAQAREDLLAGLDLEKQVIPIDLAAKEGTQRDRGQGPQ
jgi:hypothetical protein